MTKGPASFARSARLTRPAEYRRVFANAERATSRSFTLLACANDLEYSRLGLAVSRKVASRAVVRNRIKRCVRESFRRQRLLMTGWDVVVLARPAAANRSMGEMSAELDQLWNRLKRR